MMPQRVKDYAREEANRFGTRAGLLFSRSRSPVDVLARQAVMRRLRNDGFSNSQIGGWFGRDPSTVQHHVGTVA